MRKTYIIKGEKATYKPDQKTITLDATRGKVNKVDLALTPLIVGDQIVIDPIYFDYNKSKNS